ncbi:MAG: phosphoethanolamine transferase [Myxococcales bacterium]|nr:phosphoethanolamine transferase [Myxococcales bacterium]
MNTKKILRVLRTPIDTDRLVTPVYRLAREVVHSDGTAPFFAFAFLYFSVTTNLFEGSASLLYELSRASVQIVPIFLVALSLDTFRAKWPNRGILSIGPLVILLVLLAAHIVFSSIDFLSFLYFQQRINAAVIFVLAETNFSESSALIGAYSNFELLFLVLFLMVPLLLSLAVTRVRCGLHVRRGFACVFLLLSVAGMMSDEPGAPPIYNPSIAFYRGVMDYREELRWYREIKGGINDVDLDGKVASGSRARRNVHVIIVGESTGRAHMSLYGYERKTNPMLEAMRDDLYVFSDVISPNAHTTPVLKKVFTTANNEDSRNWYERPILFDIYRAAGYTTYWVSNQEAYGIWGNVASAIASRADVQIFHNRESSQELSIHWDEELLPYLDQILAANREGSQLIVLHLMGTHNRYRERYPAEFDVFTDQTIEIGTREFIDDAKIELINQYDNAVLYNDYIVSQIIDRVRAIDASSFVLYLSDHGEEVYDERDNFGHNVHIANRFMIEIPFLIWFSPEYESRNKQNVSAIVQNLDSAFMTDDLYHTLLDLSDIAYEESDPKRSLANSVFDPSRERISGGLDYDRFLKTDRSRHLIRENFDKIWVHRANSVGKLKQSESIYSGVELDLVFNRDEGGGYFDVNHPPVASIGLRLDDYLSSADPPGPMTYWLDIKNLTDQNKAEVLTTLQWIMKRHDLRADQIIAESPNFEALRHLSEGGLVTSYYLPVLDLAEMKTAEQEKLAEQLVSNARRSKAWAISCPGSMLSFARTQLHPRLAGMKVLTWFPQLQIDDWRDAVFLQTIVKADEVAAVLVGHRTPYDR